MNTPEERKVIITAFISAIVESVRALGPVGVNENQLYAAIAQRMDRDAFDMIMCELIAQKTLKRQGPMLVYCGPCMLS
jgi:hypothetical protein